jgi:hypothetical protein
VLSALAALPIRAVATWIFGFILAAIVTAFISANVRELARQRGWDTFLVRWWDALPPQLRDALRWERLRGLWWLWAIFGLSGGVTLALWLIPLIVAAPALNNDARQGLEQQVAALQSELGTSQRQRDVAQQKLAAAEGKLAARHPEAAKISQLESQLSAARQEAESAKQAAKAAQNMPPRVGPIYTLNSFSAAEALFQELLSTNTSVLVTSTPENGTAKYDLNEVLSVGARKLPPGKNLMLHEPNNARDLDVPHPISRYSGIVIHGSELSGNALNDLENVLRESCFSEPHTTRAVPDELKRYYKTDNIVWSEIGSGSPWLGSGSCPD